jgi:uncharacterized protein with PIN domain
MLGTVAKKLRILGIDCAYFKTIDDDDLVLVAKKENRVIITRDHRLADFARKHDISIVELSSCTEKEHIIEIAKKLDWKRFEFNAFNARCAICNGRLQQTQKEQVGVLPPKIAQNIQEFWTCKNCKHVYWEGTHIRNLKKFIGEVNAQL